MEINQILKLMTEAKIGFDQTLATNEFTTMNKAGTLQAFIESIEEGGIYDALESFGFTFRDIKDHDDIECVCKDMVEEVEIGLEDFFQIRLNDTVLFINQDDNGDFFWGSDFDTFRSYCNEYWIGYDKNHPTLYRYLIANSDANYNIESYLRVLAIHDETDEDDIELCIEDEYLYALEAMFKNDPYQIASKILNSEYNETLFGWLIKQPSEEHIVEVIENEEIDDDIIYYLYDNGLESILDALNEDELKTLAKSVASDINQASSEEEKHRYLKKLKEIKEILEKLDEDA